MNHMKKILSGILLLTLVFVLLSFPFAGAAGEGDLRQGIRTEGACAVVGMTPEQCQLLAKQRARAAAIEEAAGVKVTSGSLVTDGMLAADFIRTYARGFIVRESVEWLPLGQYQRDPSAAPIPEYRVRIVADVRVPRREPLGVGLTARLNRRVFKAGERACVTVKVDRPVRVAIFNIQADDRAALLFPNIHEGKNLVGRGREWVYPAANSPLELEVHPLPGHGRDAEAYFVAAFDQDVQVDFLQRFAAGKSLPLSEFFRRFAEIAERSEEVILPYEVMAAGD